MIKNVSIIPGCIGCHTCEGLCPKIFHVEDTSEVIGSEFKTYQKEILEAEKACPVQVIKVDQTESKAVVSMPKAKFVEAFPLTQDVLEFHFHFPDFHFTPGQFVTIKMHDDQGAFIRCYSVKGYESGILKLCIKILAEGRGGKFLTSLEAGTDLEISQGKGNFVLHSEEAPKLFIATGTGIAPLMAMLSQKTKSPRILLLGFRDESDQLYPQEVEHFKNTKTFTTLSRPSPSWEGAKGRVTDILETWDIHPDTEVYICGNPNMVKSTLEFFRTKKHPKKLLFAEHFKSPLPVLNPSKKNASSVSKTITGLILPWIQRLLLIASALMPLAYFFPEATGTLWDYSLYAVIFVMIIRPLSDIFPRWRLLRSFVPLRKEAGIFSASIVVTYGALHYLDPGFSFWATYFSRDYWTFDQSLFWAHLGELTGFILLITSNTWSQKFLGKWWKTIQRLAYVYFFSGAYYVGTAFGKSEALWSILVVFILWSIAFLLKLKKSWK